MPTVRDFRRQHLDNLIDAVSGPNRGKQKRFAELHGLVPAHVSQMVQGVRAMGDEVARRIEAAAGLARGSMDRPPEFHPSGAGAVAEPRATYPAREAFAIARLDLPASMGPGLAAPEHIEVVESLRVHLPQLRREVNFTAPQNLRIITGYGDSMQPTFNDGDPLLVDIGVTEIKLDAIYVLQRDDDLYIKRLQRRPDGAYLMISDNKNYEPYTIATDQRDQFKVCGRVLLAWNLRRL